MRVLIPTGIDAGFSCAGSPFDIARRPVKAPDYEEIPEALKRVIVGAREAAPNTMFHNREFVDLHDGCEGLAVFNKGLPEYQIINGDTIALTLFRSVGRIAGEINTRIGDAGPEILTPAPNVCGKCASSTQSAPMPPMLICLADHYNSDLIVAATEKSPGFLPARHSFFALEESSGNVKVPAMKRSESGDALICRGVNLSEQATRLTISPAWDAARVELANLLETPVNAAHRALVPQSQKDLWIKANLYPEAFHASICSVISGTTGAPACILEENEESEDFSRFLCTDYITEDDIENENARAEMFKDRLDDPLCIDAAPWRLGSRQFC